MKLRFLDTTLRDGAQTPGISFSTEDKLMLLRLLDRFGVDYLEAGAPATNPKDRFLFEKLKQERFSAKICAFATTVRPGQSAESDPALQLVLDTSSPAVTVVGKASAPQVAEVLQTAPEENLRMVADTVRFFSQRGREVIFDAEHFFDGYRENPDYAVRVLRTAQDAGAQVLCLCDTNGGTLPEQLAQIVNSVAALVDPKTLGVHCHNDFGLADACTLAAVGAGVGFLQVTQLGLGERCGNADFETLLPVLCEKYDAECACRAQLSSLTRLSREVSEICNLKPDERHPFVGRFAYTHKAGTHVDGIRKSAGSFEALDPALVGNRRSTVISELSGKSALLEKLHELAPDLEKDSPLVGAILDKIKSLEYEGYYYENADASLYLLISDALDRRRRFYEIQDIKLVLSDANRPESTCSAMVKVRANGKTEYAASEGNGPVDAMDRALRGALERFFPCVRDLHLTDYKVRVLNSEAATGAEVRVLMRSSFAKEHFGTVGVSTDITRASFVALCDAIDYVLTRFSASEEAR